MISSTEVHSTPTYMQHCIERVNMNQISNNAVRNVFVLHEVQFIQGDSKGFLLIH